jgi:hypothetical protein
MEVIYDVFEDYMHLICPCGGLLLAGDRETNLPVSAPKRTSQNPVRVFASKRGERASEGRNVVLYFATLSYMISSQEKNKKTKSPSPPCFPPRSPLQFLSKCNLPWYGRKIKSN